MLLLQAVLNCLWDEKRELHSLPSAAALLKALQHFAVSDSLWPYAVWHAWQEQKRRQQNQQAAGAMLASVQRELDIDMTEQRGDGTCLVSQLYTRTLHGRAFDLFVNIRGDAPALTSESRWAAFNVKLSVGVQAAFVQLAWAQHLIAEFNHVTVDGQRLLKCTIKM